MSAPELALFDLDHTLLDGDSDVEWLSFLIDEGAVDRSTEEQANADMARRYQEGAAGTLEFARFYLDVQQKRGRTFSNRSLPLPPGLHPVPAESDDKPVTRCTFPLASRERGKG